MKELCLKDDNWQYIDFESIQNTFTNCFINFLITKNDDDFDETIKKINKRKSKKMNI